MDCNSFVPAGFGWGDLYEVNAMGVIRRKGTDTPIGSVYGNGYVRVQFSRPGQIETFLAHKIVADAFLGERPYGYHIDHINGVRTDNRIENLRYCTPKQNVEYAAERGTLACGERNGWTVLTDAQVAMIRARKQEGGRFWGAAKIARELGVASCTVRRAAGGHTHSVAIRKMEPNT